MIDANGGNSGFPRILFYTLNTRNIKITYEELTSLVNDRYRDLENKGEKNIHQKLKDEFNLTTSEVWELTGLKDLLEFSE